MKTNQLMNVAFSSGNVRVYHNTSMGSLTDLFSIGNAMRVQEGKRAAVLSQFLESGRTIEFACVINEVHGISPYEVVGRGSKGGTWACLQMMIFAAEYLSPRFHLEVIDAFINNKILEWRDVSGDEFKALNIAIDNYLPKREEKSNKGIYINVARMLLKKVNQDLKSWNDASADELRDRASIENKLVTTLQLGLIKDWEHMKEIIEKI